MCILHYCDVLLVKTRCVKGLYDCLWETSDFLLVIWVSTWTCVLKVEWLPLLSFSKWPLMPPVLIPKNLLCPPVKLQFSSLPIQYIISSSFYPVRNLSEIVIRSISILELWPKICLVSSKWPLTSTFWSVNPWVQVDVFVLGFHPALTGEFVSLNNTLSLQQDISCCHIVTRTAIVSNIAFFYVIANVFHWK